MSEAQGSRRDGAAGRSLRTNGFLLWLRFHSVVVATVAAVVSAGLVAALLTAVTSANGTVIEDRPYILALLVSVCLSIVFTRETPYELVCAVADPPPPGSRARGRGRGRRAGGRDVRGGHRAVRPPGLPP
ncbi:hypothetical protein [Corynebacterium bovis]|uniref:hypothetical protein n=1 Tax=Corynebacterium bovis TaxID=36808 RepID=UPI00313A3416